jgi:hypothetical protein
MPCQIFGNEKRNGQEEEVVTNLESALWILETDETGVGPT